MPAHHTASLAAFPASDAPASEHTIKAMLLSQQTSLQIELRASVSQIISRIEDVETLTDHL